MLFEEGRGGGQWVRDWLMGGGVVNGGRRGYGGDDRKRWWTEIGEEGLGGGGVGDLSGSEERDCGGGGVNWVADGRWPAREAMVGWLMGDEREKG